MHITTVLSDKYMAMVGEVGGKDWHHPIRGRQADHLGRRIKKLADELNSTSAAAQAGKPIPASGHRGHDRPLGGGIAGDRGCARHRSCVGWGTSRQGR